MSRTAHVVFIAGKLQVCMFKVWWNCNEFYCKILAESATEKILKNRSQFIKDIGSGRFRSMGQSHKVGSGHGSKILIRFHLCYMMHRWVCSSNI